MNDVMTKKELLHGAICSIRILIQNANDDGKDFYKEFCLHKCKGIIDLLYDFRCINFNKRMMLVNIVYKNLGYEYLVK